MVKAHDLSLYFDNFSPSIAIVSFVIVVIVFVVDVGAVVVVDVIGCIGVGLLLLRVISWCRCCISGCKLCTGNPIL